MATLLKLGRRVINIDLVCEIEDYGDRIRLFYAASSSDSAGMQQQAYADIDGAAADALRTWLSAHAIELVTDQGAATEAPADLDAATERTRLLQAAAADTGGINEEVALNDNTFFGAARLQQLHGVGNDPDTETEPHPGT